MHKNLREQMKLNNWDFSVEHGHFLNFGGARSFLKFWWSTVICHILVEHGHKNLRKQMKKKNWQI